MPSTTKARGRSRPMPATKHSTKLPARFDDLVRVMPPQAIVDDVDYQNTTEMIDRLMAGGKLTRGQALYMETLAAKISTPKPPPGLSRLRYSRTPSKIRPELGPAKRPSPGPWPCRRCPARQRRG